MVTDDVFAVIAEATRRDILVSLRSGDKAVGELVEELAASQPTISKHLKVLREADLVSMRAQGQKRFYALNPKPLAGVASWLETFDVGTPAPAAVVPSAVVPSAAVPSAAESSAAAPEAPAAAAAPEAAPTRTDAIGQAVKVHASGTPVTLDPASDDTVPQQIGRTVGRAATKAADLLANLPNLPNLPKFGRKR
ncbi:metalloregulator ArsR/SmtB family transcription factor [Arthrobacter sp. AK01]|uniref:ArsR/SmtB family transcription factor n=1 Tax=Micrococcaceae TaxID=1268 RepID=UPI001E412A44|nr:MULTISPECIES: metalloregulator ArsR/SmtB family transcription factor [Micrococcaceae]MCD4852470.1 metalloregulator ArsR/SmtB family transcription factor [Arthrobacter sp. AK01]MCP1415325.1 DNA-binding transcriptional ArsR family regulator [Paenarthrobacter sp. A20]